MKPLASEIISELKRENRLLAGAVATLAAALMGCAIYECKIKRGIHRIRD